MAATVIPASVFYRGIQCSTAHITDANNSTLWQASHRREEYGDGEWLIFTGSGYLLRLRAWTRPLLRLKRLGLYCPVRRLIASLMQPYHITQLHLDALGEVLSDFDTFDW
ncbi:DUF5983 family protein [Klebsiella aerogenes]